MNRIPDMKSRMLVGLACAALMSLPASAGRGGSLIKPVNEPVSICLTVISGVPCVNYADEFGHHWAVVSTVPGPAPEPITLSDGSVFRATGLLCPQCEFFCGDFFGAIQEALIEPCHTGDLNFDGPVNSLDLGILLSSWNDSGVLADLNGDGVVNTLDLGILLVNWTL